MKKALIVLSAASMVFSLATLNGCTRQNMNDPMGSSMGPMSEEKMNPGMETLQEK